MISPVALACSSSHIVSACKRSSGAMIFEQNVDSLQVCSPGVGVRIENFWGNIAQTPEEKCHH
jgi:hypothetical protein